MRHLALLLTAAFALAATASADRPALAADLACLTAPGRVIGFDPRSPAARRGLEHILAGRALSGPFPHLLYRALRPDPDPVQRWLSEGAIPSPFARGVSLGESLTTDERGIAVVSKTCLECHAGTVAGYTVAGAGNAHLDVVPLVSLAERILAWDFTRDPERYLPSQLWWVYRYVRDYKAYAKHFLLPPYRYASARGDNLGPYGVWLMAGHMADPKRTGIIPGAPDDPRTKHERELLASIDFTTVDPQPWWTARFKTHAYWFHDSPGHAARDFHLNFYYPQRHVDHPSALDAHRAKFSAHVQMVGEVLDFVRAVPVPPLPPGQVAALRALWPDVERGEEIFHGGPNSTGTPMACTGCHGTYRLAGDGVSVGYANAGLVDVGTDRAYNDVMRRLAPIVARTALTRAFYGDAAPTYAPIDRSGYTPPVLVGLWASAPYLHNGAVPTLADMLTPPDARPVIWGRSVLRPSAYDAPRVGLDVERIDATTLEGIRRMASGQAPDHPAAIELRRFYDTRAPGRSNQGHPFGTDLAGDEKRALIDFLTAIAPTPGRARLD